MLLISCFVAGCADSDKSETSSPSFFTDDPANSFKLEADIQNNIDIMIIWEPIEDADEYILSRAVSGTGNYIDIAKFSADSEPKYIDSFIDTGICYTYKLQTADGTASESIEVDVPLYNGVFHIDGALYCYQDGCLLRDSYLGTLYFDSEGKYTTGISELDDILRELTSEYTDDSMTQLEQFSVLYHWVIDNCSYVALENVDSQSTGWEPEWALDMFQTRGGNCFSYAAAVAMLARNLGLEARGVAGECYQTYMWVTHGWTEVTYNGDVYLCDAEMEGVFAVNRDWEWDLFMKEYGSTPTQYISAQEG